MLVHVLNARTRRILVLNHGDPAVAGEIVMDARDVRPAETEAPARADDWTSP